mmetsp:Transcript_12125/g.23910  ORF Transcript_12125/g.23910 Transcript_12125/m.23910 type:complete len:212 (+) Transcript_12125:145-780(+)
MSFLFGGKKKTPDELMREYTRSIQKSTREIERERTKLQTQEKKIIADIKKAAKDGQMGPVKIMAKDLVRTRGQITKFYGMKCQMQAVGLRLQTIKSTQGMTDAMKGAARAMKSMNAQVDAKSMARILQDFEKESALMDDKQEMMDDAIDDTFEAEDEEGAINDVIGQVLAEIGIDMGAQMDLAPGGKPVQQAAAETEGEMSLEDRLANLRK